MTKSMRRRRKEKQKEKQIGGRNMTQREKDLELLRSFKEITIVGLCKELKINQANLYAKDRPRVPDEKVHEMAEELRKRLKELLKK